MFKDLSTGGSQSAHLANKRTSTSTSGFLMTSSVAPGPNAISLADRPRQFQCACRIYFTLDRVVAAILRISCVLCAFPTLSLLRCCRCLLVLCRYDLHVLLVEHGKRCKQCASQNRPSRAPDGPCPLQSRKSALCQDNHAQVGGKADERNSGRRKRPKLDPYVKIEEVKDEEASA